MDKHQVANALETCDFPTSWRMAHTPEGFHLGGGKTVGNGVQDWAPNALFIHSDGGAGARWYRNTGTSTTASWAEIYQVAALDDISFADNGALIFGTGSDVKVLWDASKLTMGPSTGFWSGCPFIRYGNGHTLAYELFDDFLQLAVGDAAGWTTDATNGTATLGAAEAANTPGLGGYVTLNVPGTAEDWISMKATSADTGAAFKMTKDSGKKVWWEARLMISSVSDICIYVGLADYTCTEVGADDTGAENFGAAQDFVGFRVKNDAPTEIDQICVQNGTENEIKANGGTLAANTAITLGLLFDGVNTVTFYINGTALADTIATDGTAFPDDVGLTPFFFIKEGAGASKSLHIDWVKCVQLR